MSVLPRPCTGICNVAAWGNPRTTANGWGAEPPRAESAAEAQLPGPSSLHPCPSYGAPVPPRPTGRHLLPPVPPATAPQAAFWGGGERRAGSEVACGWVGTSEAGCGVMSAGTGRNTLLTRRLTRRTRCPSVTRPPPGVSSLGLC
uniref:Uncharacterized protein n=1 Tax=Pipistrellus kuhlii TaxID=59472 RepID=A0A7J7RGU3_PIPKU|nr:hypothetical protein mPipKuh1_010549 [Pipistrellus kuhlii]